MKLSLYPLIFALSLVATGSLHALSSNEAAVSNGVLVLSNLASNNNDWSITRSGTVYSITHTGSSLTAISPVVSTGSNTATLDTSTTPITGIQIDLGSGADVISSAGTSDEPIQVPLTINAGEEVTLTSGGIFSSSDVTINSDEMDISGEINTPGNTVTLRPVTSGHEVHFNSTTNSASALELTDTEIDLISCSDLNLGSSAAGGVTFFGDILVNIPVRNVVTGTVSVISNGDIIVGGTSGGGLNTQGASMAFTAAGNIGTSSDALQVFNDPPAIITALSTGGTEGIYFDSSGPILFDTIEAQAGNVSMVVEGGVIGDFIGAGTGNSDTNTGSVFIDDTDTDDFGIEVGLIQATGDTIEIETILTIQEPSPGDTAADLVADVIDLTAAEGIYGNSTTEALEVDTGSQIESGLSAIITGASGIVNIEETSGSMVIRSSTMNDGSLNLKSNLILNIESFTGGNITAFLEASLDFNIDFFSISGEVEFSSQNSNLRELNDDPEADIIAERIEINVGDGIGRSTNPIEVDATSTASDKGLLFSAPGDESLFVDAINDIFLSSASTDEGFIQLSAAGDVIYGDVTTNGGFTSFNVAGEYFFLSDSSLESSDGWNGSSGDTMNFSVDSTPSNDQLSVTGPVDITDVTLVINVDPTNRPTIGQSFTLIDNDGTDAITGTFLGLAEGATATASNGDLYTITYVGGSGNDVVVTVSQLDTTPPSVLSITPSTLGPTAGPITFTVLFDEPVSGFTTQNAFYGFRGLAGGGSIDQSVPDQGTSDTWSIILTPTATTAEVQLQVFTSSNQVLDRAGNVWSSPDILSEVFLVASNGSDFSTRTLLDTTSGVSDGYLDNADGDAFNNVSEYFLDLASQTQQSASDFEGKFTNGIVLNGTSEEVFSITIPVPNGTSFSAIGTTVDGTLDLLQDITLSVSGYTTPGGTPDLNVVVNSSPDTTGLPALSSGYSYVEFQLEDSIGEQTKGFMRFEISVETLGQIIGTGD